MGGRVCSGMVRDATRVHLVGFAWVLGVAVILLLLLFPVVGRRIATRDLPIYFITVAVVPIVLWVFPPFVRALARSTYRAHRAMAGKGVSTFACRGRGRFVSAIPSSWRSVLSRLTSS